MSICKTTETFIGKTRVLSGEGSLKYIKKELIRLGISKPLMVVGKQVRENPVLARYLEENFKTCVHFFDDFTINPDDSSVYACVEICRLQKNDGLISIGGGSCMDVAKAVSVLFYKNTNGETLFSKTECTYSKKLPVIAIPTTAGTGSEISRNAVITEKSSGNKRRYMDDNLACEAIILDPSLLIGMPFNVFRDAAIDAVSHAVESYTYVKKHHHRDFFYSKVSSEALKLLLETIPKARVTSLEDIKVLETMQWGSLLAGLGLGTGLDFCHILSGIVNKFLPSLSHGEATGMILVAAIRHEEMKYPNILEIFNSKSGFLSEQVSSVMQDVEFPKLPSIFQEEDFLKFLKENWKEESLEIDIDDVVWIIRNSCE